MTKALRRPIFIVALGEDPAAFEDVLRAHYLSYPSLAKRLSFDESFECILVDPSPVFVSNSASAAKTVEFLRGAKLPAETDQVLNLVSQGRSATREAHAALLPFLEYRLSKDTRIRAQQFVAERVQAVLEERPGVRAGNWAVIAHSLGAAIAHDALHLLYRKGAGGRRPLSPARDFMSVFLCAANTSRLMEQDVDAYRSMVRPMARVGTGSCEWYLNVRHEWDPMAMPKPFNPVLGWPTPDAADRFQTIVLRHFLSQDIHSLVHHLEDPDVHTRLFEGMTAMRVDSRELWEARDGFKRRTDTVVFDRIRGWLKEVQLDSGDDWMRILPAWGRFMSMSKGAGEGIPPVAVDPLRTAA